MDPSVTFSIASAAVLAMTTFPFADLRPIPCAFSNEPPIIEFSLNSLYLFHLLEHQL